MNDRDEIFDVAVRYATALDTCDWDLLRTCFVPDVIGRYGGDLGEVHGYEALEEICKRTLEPLDGSQHIVSNFAVQLRGDEADFSCYLQSQHIMNAAEGGPLFTLAGRYTDLFRRTDDGWKIAERELATMWVSGNPAVLAHVL
jgi:ketosteroid isomerase-like protein